MKTAPMRSFFRPEMILLSVILYLIEFVRGAALISFIPIYGNDALGFDLGVVGAAITAHYLIDTVVKLSIGYLMHHLSVKLLVNGGLFASLIGVAIIGYANVPWLFITGAAIFGIGISPIWIVCLTRVQENHRGTQMGILYTIWLVGLGSGPVVTNFLLERSNSLTFWILVSVSCIVWLLSFLIPSGTKAEVQVVPFRQQLAVLGSRLNEMKLLLPGMVLQTLAAGMLQPILPSFAKDHLGMTPPEYSLLLFIGGGCTIAGLIPMGRLSDSFGKKWFLVFGFLLFGVALYGLTLRPSLVSSLTLAFVLGISYAAVLPAWNALLAAYVPPDQKGLGWGVLSTVEGIGGLVGPGIGGWIATAHGEPIVVTLTAFIFAGISIIYFAFPFRLFRGENPIRA